MRIIIFVLIILFSVSLVNAADYYVSPTGSGTVCSEGAPCSISSYSPFVNAVAGDTWHFAGGAYSMPASVGYEFPPTDYQIGNSGTVGNEIVFKAVTGETPVFVGDGSNSTNNQVVMLYNDSNTNITIDGLTFIAYSSASGTGDPLIPKVRLSSSTDIPLNIVLQNCIFDGNEVVSDIEDNMMMLWLSDGGSYASYVTIQNNIFKDFWADTSTGLNFHGQAAIMPYGYFEDATNPHHITIKNNTFNNISVGVYFKGNNNPAHDIDIYNNFFNNVETAVVYGTNGPDSVDTYNNIIILGRPSGNSDRIITGVDINSYQQDALLNDVYNNTIYSADVLANKSAGIIGNRHSGKIYNNIIQLGIVGTGGAVGAGYFWSTSSITGLNNNNFSNSPFTFYAETVAYSTISTLEASAIVVGTDNFCASTSPCNNIATASTFINTSGSMNTVADFALTAASPGYQAGSDGEDMGADVSLVGSGNESSASGSTPLRTGSSLLTTGSTPLR